MANGLPGGGAEEGVTYDGWRGRSAHSLSQSPSLVLAAGFGPGVASTMARAARLRRLLLLSAKAEWGICRNPFKRFRRLAVS